MLQLRGCACQCSTAPERFYDGGSS